MGKVPPPLTAKHKGSFAYLTVKDRLPVILTKVIDHLCRQKLHICKDYGQEVAEEIKRIVGQLSQLKNEMQTNKPFMQFSKNSRSTSVYDIESYNQVIQAFTNEFGTDPKWFTSNWLFAECYLFKRIHEAFSCSHSLNCYDPFRHLKVQSCESATETLELLSERMMEKIFAAPILSLEDKKAIIVELIQVSLWGNQCDLSISSGEDYCPHKNILSRLGEMSEHIMCSQEESFWEYLCKVPEEKTHIALVLDNAGVELVADLCLAAALTKLKLVSSVTFYTKTIPWFVSDTTLSDFNWTLEFLRNQGGNVAEVCTVFDNLLEKETWKIREHIFWTGPHDYSVMEKEDPDLYNELSQYSLIIFKGDLNYRKLVGDLDWPNETPFRTALRGFLPSSLLVLRTIKGGPVVGIDQACHKVQKAKAKEDWFKSGEMGLIQFIPQSRGILNNFSTWIITGVVILVLSYLLRFRL